MGIDEDLAISESEEDSPADETKPAVTLDDEGFWF